MVLSVEFAEIQVNIFSFVLGYSRLPVMACFAMCISETLIDYLIVELHINWICILLS